MPSKSLSELLRDALRNGPSIYSVSKATGLEPSSLLRFRDGVTSLRLDKADILAAYFGIESRRVRRTKKEG